MPAGSRWGTGLLREYEAEETGNKQQQQQQQCSAVTLKCPFTQEQEKEEKQAGSMFFVFLFFGSSQRVTQRCTQVDDRLFINPTKMNEQLFLHFKFQGAASRREVSSGQFLFFLKL